MSDHRAHILYLTFDRDYYIIVVFSALASRKSYETHVTQWHERQIQHRSNYFYLVIYFKGTDKASYTPNYLYLHIGVRNYGKNWMIAFLMQEKQCLRR